MFIKWSLNDSVSTGNISAVVRLKTHSLEMYMGLIITTLKFPISMANTLPGSAALLGEWFLAYFPYL
jgi:hypothetical protein